MNDKEWDVSLAKILGIENEYDLLNKQAKTPEEIEKWCTKEDMPEVKRCVHLLKKGYEIQKISVINNLDRYMTEEGANEELFSIIIDSLMDWDDKMQKECAYSFIKPLELDLVSKRNKEKVCKAAVQIVVDDDNAENTDLLESWIKVLNTVVSRVDIKFMAEHVTKIIKEIPGLKHPFAKRKRGNRFIFGVALQVGETGFDGDKELLKCVQSICSDNNYKIRRDGCIFFKEYFKQDRESIINNSRFRDIYMPNLIEFLNDEDLHIQLDAIEAVTEILDCLTIEEVENDFIPCVLNFLDIEDQSQLEIVTRISEIFGCVLVKLQEIDLHTKYKDQFMSFYKEIVDHKEDSIRLKAVYNLPCMNLLYKPLESELKISFQEYYLKFSEDKEFDVRYCAAASLHEALKLTEDEEDISNLRQVFLSCILDPSRDMILLMNSNLVLLIQKYGNKHTIDNFKGRTPYIQPNADSDSGSNNNTPKSKPQEKNKNADFSTAIEINQIKKQVTKKNTHLGISFDDEFNDNSPKLPPIYVTPQHESEVVYSDLLQRLMVFINNLRGYTGLWREHVKLIQNLTQVIDLFYMPEIHQYLVPMLVEWIWKGNRETKEASCELLTKILKFQHHSPSRDELLNIILKEMAHATNWMQRKAYVVFCKHAIQTLSRDYFKKHFMKDYMSCSQDKVPHVRMEFANAMLQIKPFFDHDMDLSLELMDILNHLHNDSDRDVLEAVELTDFELLQNRKKNKEAQADDSIELNKVAVQKQLLIREKEEIEERKKRVDDEEESKYDMTFADSKRLRSKYTFKSNYKRPGGSMSSNKVSMLGSSSNQLKKLPLGSLNDTGGYGDSKTPLKKKQTMTSKKLTSNNGFSENVDFSKQRKNSILIGGSKEEQIKRYHQMISSNGTQINGTASTSSQRAGTNNNTTTGKNGTAKPRRNTVMAVNGQLPHTNGL